MEKCGEPDPAPAQSPGGNGPIAKLDEMLLTVVRSLEPLARESLLSCVRTGSYGRVHIPLESSIHPPTPTITGAASALVLLRRTTGKSSIPHSTAIMPLAPPIAPAALSPVSGVLVSGGRSGGLVPSGIPATPTVSTPSVSSFLGISKPRKHVTVKHYSDAVPSMHCHVCCRSAKNVKVHACARVKEAVCRKVVCVRCFAENGWTFAEGWTCSHCRGICPKRGQCYTYGRSNMRRRQETIRRQMERALQNEEHINAKRATTHGPAQGPVQFSLPSPMAHGHKSLF